MFGRMWLQKFSHGHHWVLLLVSWCRVLWPNAESSSSYYLNSGQHYLFQTLDVGLHVEFKSMWEDG